jgi:hypothetical protein
VMVVHFISHMGMMPEVLLRRSSRQMTVFRCYAVGPIILMHCQKKKPALTGARSSLQISVTLLISITTPSPSSRVLDSKSPGVYRIGEWGGVWIDPFVGVHEDQPELFNPLRTIISVGASACIEHATQKRREDGKKKLTLI